MFLNVLISSLIFGTLAAREPDIDINRIHLLPVEKSDSVSRSSHGRRSVLKSSESITNGYDGRSSGRSRLLPTSSLRSHVPTVSSNRNSQTSLKVHQPREDPRLFYQSETYLKEINGQNINHEVIFIYPGREPIRASEENSKLMPLRLNPKDNVIDDGLHICIRCPHDRTLVARAGSDRVQLRAPRLFSCSGHKAPRNIHFVHMYGPKFGSLLERGSHVVVGRIMHKGKTLHHCKMQLEVILQTCATPKYLISHCDGKNCSFTCQNSKSDLYGQPSLTCGSNMKWIGDLPVCRVRTWCEPPLPPNHGRVSCKGSTAGAGPGLVEGSKCRVRCAKGWQWHRQPRAFTVCRRGSWTNTLTC